MKTGIKNKGKQGAQHLLVVLFFFIFPFVQPALLAQNKAFLLLKNAPDKVIIRFQADSIHFSETQTSRGTAWIPFSDQGGHAVLKNGVPVVWQYAVPVRIPTGDSSMQVKILSSRFSTLKNILLAPSRGEIPRTSPPDSLTVSFGKEYQLDTLYPATCWKTDQPYVIRHEKGQSLLVFPLQYNPVKKVLRIYHEITFEITFLKKKGNKAFLLPTETKTFFRPSFINPETSSFKNQQQPAALRRMLIISDGQFIPLLKDFIHWKRQTGFEVTVTDGSRFTDAQSIKDYIRTQYLGKAIEYVLLVGDAQQIPSGIMAGNTSDLFYAYVDGNDHYPDVIVGRFPAETEEQLRIMLQRTLSYEKALSKDTGWYTRAIGIASEEGPGYHQLTDAQHIRWIDSVFLQPGGYTSVTELFDGTYGPNDAPGDPDAEDLLQAIEKGTGLINYCGHGSVLGWTTTHFGNPQINALTNTDSWPVIFSVSCATGDFVHHDCFAESWLRAAYEDKPAGAVAVLMPSAAQSWAPPMCAQQEMNRLLTLPDSADAPRTFGMICIAGCLKMNDEFGTEGYETTDSWILFGDPSLTIRTKTPVAIRADYTPVLCDTCRQINLFTSVKNGCVTLMAGDSLYASTLTDAFGNARLTVPALPPEKKATLTITAFNHRPFTGSIIWNTSTEKSGDLLFNCFPNPAQEKTNISLVLKKAERIVLSVADISGKNREVLFSGMLEAGFHLFPWHPVKKGMYLIELKSGNHLYGKKVIVTK